MTRNWCRTIYSLDVAGARLNIATEPIGAGSSSASVSVQLGAGTTAAWTAVPRKPGVRQEAWRPAWDLRS